MEEKTNWINQRKNYSRIFLGSGVAAFVGGISLELLKIKWGFDPRVISGLGIFLLGVSLANYVRYRAAVKNPAAARRVFNEEKDERMVLIRMRAGNRAFWVSITLTYTCLMWESMASNGSLPKLSSDGQWFFLAAAVVIPFAVYIISIIRDQNNF